MIDLDDYYKRIERDMTGELKSSGQMEGGFWQSIGKFIEAGSSKRGQMFENMLSNTERIMAGQKKHGFEQNKKSELDKLIEKGAKDGTGA